MTDTPTPDRDAEKLADGVLAYSEGFATKTDAEVLAAHVQRLLREKETAAGNHAVVERWLEIKNTVIEKLDEALTTDRAARVKAEAEVSRVIGEGMSLVAALQEIIARRGGDPQILAAQTLGGERQAEKWLAELREVESLLHKLAEARDVDSLRAAYVEYGARYWTQEQLDEADAEAAEIIRALRTKDIHNGG